MGIALKVIAMDYVSDGEEMIRGRKGREDRGGKDRGGKEIDFGLGRDIILLRKGFWDINCIIWICVGNCISIATRYHRYDDMTNHTYNHTKI